MAMLRFSCGKLHPLIRKGYRGFKKKKTKRCLHNALNLKERLWQAKFGVLQNELSSTVVFERPLEKNIHSQMAAGMSRLEFQSSCLLHL